MKILVLGGCGTQGRTAIYDLASDPDVSRIICADTQFGTLDAIKKFTDMTKITLADLDARNERELAKLFLQADVVIDLLPREFGGLVFQTALKTGISVVNTNYLHQAEKLDVQAKEVGITIMPECGLDPGIDLVLYGKANRMFDQLYRIDSYCGGFPEKKACDNVLNYKVSWIWRGVLAALMRESRIIKNGQTIDIPGMNQHDKANIHSIEVDGFGELEAMPNGDATYFTDQLGLTDSIVETGRYSLRWPGWSDFWRPLKELGLLSDTPVDGLACRVTPIDFLDKLLGPRLVYRDNEKDIVVMVNIFEGMRNRKQERFTCTMVIERDLETGIMAMSKGVGFSSAIVARMIVDGRIPDRGVLSPMKHIPTDEFIKGLKKRGITIKEETTLLKA